MRRWRWPAWTSPARSSASAPATSSAARCARGSPSHPTFSIAITTKAVRGAAKPPRTKSWPMRDLKQHYGFTTHKLKGGHFSPDHDVAVMEALAAAFPDDQLRLDPNGVWSVEQAIR